MDRLKDMDAEGVVEQQQRLGQEALATEFQRLLDKPALFALSKDDDDRAVTLAQRIVKGGWAPKGMSFEACYCAIVFGAELGIPAMQAVQNIAVINGRPGVFGDMALALVQASKKLEGVPDEHFDGTGDDLKAVCVVRRKGSEKETRRTFSVAQAKKARLWGKQGPWSEYPARMLQMRARALALRDAFADVLRGVAIAEEYIGVNLASATNGSRVEVSEDELLKDAFPELDDPTGGTPAAEKKEPEAPKAERKRPPRKHPRDTAAEMVAAHPELADVIDQVLQDAGCESGKLEDADEAQARAVIKFIDQETMIS